MGHLDTTSVSVFPQPTKSEDFGFIRRTDYEDDDEDGDEGS